VHAANPSDRSLVNCRARPSMTFWILRLQAIRRLSEIAIVCMPDGPFVACRTARVFIRCVVRQPSRKH
jgi:hypothetical protein